MTKISPNMSKNKFLAEQAILRCCWRLYQYNMDVKTLSAQNHCIGKSEGQTKTSCLLEWWSSAANILGILFFAFCSSIPLRGSLSLDVIDSILFNARFLLLLCTQVMSGYYLSALCWNLPFLQLIQRLVVLIKNESSLVLKGNQVLITQMDHVTAMSAKHTLCSERSKPQN